MSTSTHSHRPAPEVFDAKVVEADPAALEAGAADAVDGMTAAAPDCVDDAVGDGDVDGEVDGDVDGEAVGDPERDGTTGATPALSSEADADAEGDDDVEVDADPASPSSAAPADSEGVGLAGAQVTGAPGS